MKVQRDSERVNALVEQDLLKQLTERDKLIDDMVKWIDDADFWSAAERFQARAEAMRGGEK